MKDPDKILTPDEVASLMPPSISRSWIEAHWKELGGTNVAGRKLILWSALHSNLQSEQNRICQRETIDFSEISDPDCKRENHISQRINPNQNKSIPKIIFFRDGRGKVDPRSRSKGPFVSIGVFQGTRRIP